MAVNREFYLTTIIAFLLTLLPATCVLAEIGPAASGLTASAHDAMSVFYSPAGITRGVTGPTARCCTCRTSAHSGR